MPADINGVAGDGLNCRRIRRFAKIEESGRGDLERGTNGRKIAAEKDFEHRRPTDIGRADHKDTKPIRELHPQKT